LNGFLAAAAGALTALAYTWLVAGRPDPLMAARGLASAVVATAAFAPFVPPWAALAVGAAAGLLTPLTIFTVDRLLRWDDPAAVLTVHGLGGVLGLVALGIFADGKAGAGWNGVGAVSYLGVAGQGVTGLLAAAGYQPDWPAQMQAQAVGVAALALFGFFVAWALLMPPATLARLLRPRPVDTAQPAARIPDTAPSPLSGPPAAAVAAAAAVVETPMPPPDVVDEPPVPNEAPADSAESDASEVA
jgi:Amt family ammonium transporter